jgi:hypothetical protein
MNYYLHQKLGVMVGAEVGAIKGKRGMQNE